MTYEQTTKIKITYSHQDLMLWVKSSISKQINKSITNIKDEDINVDYNIGTKEVSITYKTQDNDK